MTFTNKLFVLKISFALSYFINNIYITNKQLARIDTYNLFRTLLIVKLFNLKIKHETKLMYIVLANIKNIRNYVYSLLYML